jgi:hypothetical protein
VRALARAQGAALARRASDWHQHGGCRGGAAPPCAAPQPRPLFARCRRNARWGTKQPSPQALGDRIKALRAEADAATEAEAEAGAAARCGPTGQQEGPATACGQQPQQQQAEQRGEGQGQEQQQRRRPCCAVPEAVSLAADALRCQLVELHGDMVLLQHWWGGRWG